MSELRIKGCFEQCAVAVRLHAMQSKTVPETHGHATMTISTGAADVQTYLTPAECRELARMLNQAACDVAKLEAA